MDLSLIATIAASCLLGGLLKGISGSGLPSVAVPLIALLSDVPTAVAIVQIPSLLINVLQARPRKNDPQKILRHWPIAATLFVASILGVSLLRIAPPAVLLLFVASLTLLAALFLILVPNFSLRRGLWLPVGIPVATAAGISAGMSSLAGPLLVPYLVALRLPKDLFISVVSLCYMSSIIPTIGAFLYWNVVEPRIFVLSILAIIPAVLGMWLGTLVRDRVDEKRFRYVVLTVLIGAALLLIFKAIS